jgi:3-oxoacyl-[acyl-carrier-protein] synthase-3
MRTDPGWADYYRGEIVGDRIFMRRRGHRKGLGDAYVRNFVELVSEPPANSSCRSAKSRSC